ncbi:MAG: hypothetical protein JXL97_01715 [Bacteroidales bacterium]|nr:hypothetical protein [Bacteroidales bacterium]
MKTVTINQQPTTVEEFTKLRDELATTPEGGAAVFLMAYKIFNENESLGEQCLVIAIDRGSLQEGNVYKGFKLLNGDLSRIKSQLAQNPKLPNSYIKGSTAENDYSVNLPYIFEFSTNSSSGTEADGYIKFFVECSGADSPRPLHVMKNNRDIWKAKNWSSVLVGIKKKAIDDDI